MNSTYNMTYAYPSATELLPDVLMAKLPTTLARDIVYRYLSLGRKYQTKKQHTDGRFINKMMFTNRIDNCLEEVVDAVFCVIGQIFKDTVAGKQPSDNLYTILDGLVQIYSLLKVESLQNAMV